MFQYDIDEVNLDGFDYKNPLGRHSIWRKYRANIDELSYKIYRIKLNKNNQII